MSSAMLDQLGGSSPLAAMAGSTLGIKSQGETDVALLSSRSVEDAIIQRFGLMDRYRVKTMVDARRALEGKSKITLGAKDDLIHVAVEDTDPQKAADLANGYVEEFSKLNARLALTEAAQRRRFFEQQLADAKNRLADAEEALKQTQQSTGMLQLDGQDRAMIESVSSLRAQVVAKQVQIQGLRSFGTEENPEVILARQQLSELQAQLEKLAGKQNDGGSDLILSRGKAPEAGMEYIRKLRDVKYYETLFEIMARQLEAAKVDEARQGSMVQVVDIAVKPEKKSFPPRSIIVILAMFVAFFAAITWVLLREGIVQSMETSENRESLELLRTHLKFR